MHSSYRYRTVAAAPGDGRNGDAGRRSPLLPLGALLLLLCCGCGTERKTDIEGDSPVVIQLLFTVPSPLSFAPGAEPETVTVAFSYVDPYAEPAVSVLLHRVCGNEPPLRTELPLAFLTPAYSGVGSFGVRVSLTRDCAVGSYPFLLSMVDAKGKESNQVEVHYLLTP